MTGHIPFLVRRRQLSRPPANTVHTDDGEPNGRPLRFLDHGDSLHDTLITGLIHHAKKICKVTGGVGRTVMFDERHAVLAVTQGKNLFATVAMIDLAQDLLPNPNLTALELRIELAPTTVQQAALRADVELVREWWRADRRWLRSELPPLLIPTVLHIEGRTCKPLPESVAWSALSPIANVQDSYCARSRGNPVNVSALMIDEARRCAGETFATESNALCSKQVGRLRLAIDERISQVEVELDDLIAVREADVAKRSAEQTSLGEQVRTGRIAAAQRAVAMIEEAGRARLEWLRGIASDGVAPEITVLGEVLFRPVSASAW
jgi:ATP-dependent helicase HepA